MLVKGSPVVWHGFPWDHAQMKCLLSNLYKLFIIEKFVRLWSTALQSGGACYVCYVLFVPDTPHWRPISQKVYGLTIYILWKFFLLWSWIWLSHQVTYKFAHNNTWAVELWSDQIVMIQKRAALILIDNLYFEFLYPLWAGSMFSVSFQNSRSLLFMDVSVSLLLTHLIMLLYRWVSARKT